MSTITAIISKYLRGEVLRRRASSTIAVVVENFASFFYRCFLKLDLFNNLKLPIERTDRRDKATYNLTASTRMQSIWLNSLKDFSYIIAL